MFFQHLAGRRFFRESSLRVLNFYSGFCSMFVDTEVFHKYRGFTVNFNTERRRRVLTWIFFGNYRMFTLKRIQGQGARLLHLTTDLKWNFRKEAAASFQASNFLVNLELFNEYQILLLASSCFVNTIVIRITLNAFPLDYPPI